MAYIHNPKTQGSGILCCIPQIGKCPNNCPDCFYQSGASYLEPLSENLPNIPYYDVQEHQVVRVNDGNDSNNDWNTVVHGTSWFYHRFFNTSVPKLDFPAPVVLTLNPADKTDKDFHVLQYVPANLMFLRWRANLWNIAQLKDAITFYTGQQHAELRRRVPIVVTWMCYSDENSIPGSYRHGYEWRTHVSNPYWQVRPSEWDAVMLLFRDNPYVYSCGTPWSSLCSRCGNCLREWHATMERMEKRDD